MKKENLVSKILKLLENSNTEITVENFVENCVSYALGINHCKTNWIARDLFDEILSEDEMAELFDEK